jgi:hypothetical protein
MQESGQFRYKPTASETVVAMQRPHSIGNVILVEQLLVGPSSEATPAYKRADLPVDETGQ